MELPSPNFVIKVPWTFKKLRCKGASFHIAIGFIYFWKKYAFLWAKEFQISKVSLNSLYIPIWWKWKRIYCKINHIFKVDFLYLSSDTNYIFHNIVVFSFIFSCKLEKQLKFFVHPFVCPIRSLITPVGNAYFFRKRISKFETILTG